MQLCAIERSAVHLEAHQCTNRLKPRLYNEKRLVDHARTTENGEERENEPVPEPLHSVGKNRRFRRSSFPSPHPAQQKQLQGGMNSIGQNQLYSKIATFFELRFPRSLVQPQPQTPNSISLHFYLNQRRMAPLRTWRR